MKKTVQRYTNPGEWEVVVTFDSEGVEREWVGVVDGRRPGEYSLTVIAQHSVAKTKGRITIRAVCGEQSVVKIKGIIRIAKDAQETDDFLEIRVLTLGKNSRAIAEPVLEIEANNVVASHGASVGPIDPEQLMYLAGRGLPTEECQNLIINGHLLE